MTNKIEMEQLLPETGPDPEGHLTITALERLTAEEDAQARAHLEACADCRARLAEVEAQRRAFLHQLPVERVAAQFTDPGSAPRRARLVAWLAPALAAAALGLAMFALWPEGQPTDSPGQDDVRVKGAVSLRAMAMRGQQRWQARSGEGFLPGDALQLEVFSTEQGYVRVLGRAPQGLTHYFPDQAREPGRFAEGLAIAAQEPLRLPESLQLDDETGEEWLIILVSSAPIAPAAAEALASSLELTAGGVPLELEAPGIIAIGFDVTRREK